MFKFIFLFLLSFNACAFDEWSEADKTREAVYLAVDTADWLQTRNIARHRCTNPDTGNHDCVETNAILGEHPSIGQVNNYFISTMLLHVGIVTVLPSKYRSVFQFTSIAYEASYVYGNYRIGISAKF